MGFVHSQSRTDRDKYIEIHRENIKEGKEGNFEIRQYSDTFGLAYGYDSVMHYGGFFFSANNLRTITTIDPSQQDKIGKLTTSKRR